MTRRSSGLNARQEAVLARAISQIEAMKCGKSRGNYSLSKLKAEAANRNSNAWIALYSPPLPAHIKKERNDKETQRLAILINQAHGKSGASYDYGVGQYNSD